MNDIASRLPQLQEGSLHKKVGRRVQVERLTVQLYRQVLRHTPRQLQVGNFVDVDFPRLVEMDAAGKDGQRQAEQGRAGGQARD